MCFNLLTNVCVKQFSFYGELCEIWSKMYIALHVKYPFFWSHFSATLIFVTDFLKIIKYQILWKSVKWESELFHADRQTGGRTDGQTDISKIIVAFRNFEYTPKNATTANITTTCTTITTTKNNNKVDYNNNNIWLLLLLLLLLLNLVFLSILTTYQLSTGRSLDIKFSKY